MHTVNQTGNIIHAHACSRHQLTTFEGEQNTDLSQHSIPEQHILPSDLILEMFISAFDQAMHAGRCQ